MPLAADFSARPLWFGNPALETSNQKTAFYPAASSATELLDLFAAPLVPKVLLLNCNFALPDPTNLGFTGNVAGLEFNDLGIVYDTTQSGRMKETANGCIVDMGASPTEKPSCYETVGDARIDFMTQDVQIFKTLELQEFTSFGYPTNSP